MMICFIWLDGGLARVTTSDISDAHTAYVGRLTSMKQGFANQLKSTPRSTERISSYWMMSN
jgi:hypothetical protein